MITSFFHVGQLWSSDMEPELGIGLISAVNERTLQLVFPFADMSRIYAISSAPLKRIQFHVGDTITSKDMGSFVIESILEIDELFYYLGEGNRVAESHITTSSILNTPVHRLISLQVESNEAFMLRCNVLDYQVEIAQSCITGLIGPRIQLIPHQLFSVNYVLAKTKIRVLLADEFGLGKTIEACLLLHALMLRNQIQRVLILVPEPLMIQWFVELLRKFNLMFTLADDFFFRQAAALNLVENPFSEHQLVLAPLSNISGENQRRSQLINAGWDLVIVDEAHHLVKATHIEWANELAGSVDNLILITATPQLNDLDCLSAMLQLRFPDSFVMVRNTRKQAGIFPKRHIHLAPVEPANPQQQDPRLRWLALLLDNLNNDKLLLCCHSKEDAIGVYAALPTLTARPLALFHEGMTLFQRDKMAAHFSDDQGAVLLICSEIGSEGRNFQFAHHIVFFDYPIDIDLIQQRIGRLDRMGQLHDIHIHLPYIIGTFDEVYVSWLHQGVDIFNHIIPYGNLVIELFYEQLIKLGHEGIYHKDFPVLIQSTQIAVAHHSQHYIKEQMNLPAHVAFSSEVAAETELFMNEFRQSLVLDSFLVSVWDYFGVDYEEVQTRTWFLKNIMPHSELFPGIRGDEVLLTCDRDFALRRDDVPFITWDHPIMRRVIDLVLGSELGNVALGTWADATSHELYLECVFVLECVGPPLLRLEQYLPPTPIRVMVDHQGKNVTRLYACDKINSMIKDGLPAYCEEKWLELVPLLTRLQGDCKEIAENIREEKIKHIFTLIRHEKAVIGEHLLKAHLRLDAMRFICRG